MLTSENKSPCLAFYRHHHTKRCVLLREVGYQLLLFKKKTLYTLTTETQ